MDHSGKTVGGAAATPGGERRASPRASSRIEVSYEDVDGHVFLPARDVSESGIFLLSHASPPIGVTATVLMELPGHPAILRLRGNVARHQTYPVAGFALRFDPQATVDSSRRALRDFIESALSRGGAAHPPRMRQAAD